MEISEKELEIKLIDVGEKIRNPPQLDSELLDSLNLVENLLARVEQSPSTSLKEAIIPITKALVTEGILRHSDVDIQVAVASCISEITRISAPDSPYEDEEMKEVFQLIVSSFENLHDKSSRSYTRRISILETVAKVRSCVVMLDLECDDLIVEMVRIFFRTIRDDLYDCVFSSMETIMTVVLEESEDISVDLLSQFLSILKKDNEEVLPVACRLAEEVFAKCGSKIKPYLLQAVTASGASLDDYRKAVADVFLAGDEAVEPTGDAANEIPADEGNMVNVPSEVADEVAMETMEDAPPSEEAGPINVGSPSTVRSNGILKKGNEDAPATNDSIKEADNVTQDEKAKPSKTGVDSVADEEPLTSKTKPKKASKRKAAKPSSTKSSSEPSEPVLPNRKKEVVNTQGHHENDDKNVDDIPIEDPKIDTTAVACNEKQSEVLVPSSATSEKACVDISSPSPSGSLNDEIHSEKKGQGKRKSRPLEEDKSVSAVDSKEATVLEQPTLNKQASKKSSFASDKEDMRLDVTLAKNLAKKKSADSSDDTKKDDDNINEEGVTLAKNLVQDAKVGSKLVNKKIRSQAKVTPAKGNAKTGAKDGIKKTVALPKSTPKATKDTEEALKTSSKRKHPDEGKKTEIKGSGPELVGARVEVWWPDDKLFYKGIIQSFNAAAKLHKVFYDDGDVEVLNLKNEKWNLLGDFEGHTSEAGNPRESADETPKVKKAKTIADIGTSKGKNISSTKTSKASLSKSKVTPKSGSNLKDDGKVAVKSKEEAASKKGAKSDVDKIEKSKALKSGNKSSEETPKLAQKSKDASKSAAKSKGKSQKSVGKDLPTTIDIKDSEDEPIETERMPEMSKEKSLSSFKPENSSNKRKRSIIVKD